MFCRFTIIAEEVGARLPALKGSIFYDQCFQESMYHNFCKKKNMICENCSSNPICPYPFMYKNIPAWKSQQFGSVAPFTWKPPLEKKTVYMKGEKVQYSLTLIGNAYKHLKKMINVLEGYLIKKEHSFGKLMLKKVVTENPFTKEQEIVYSSKTAFNEDALVFIHGNEIESWAKQNMLASGLLLTFLTPTCFKYKNECVKEVHFYYLVRELLLRVQTLYYFYHNRQELNINYQKYLRGAEEVQKVSDQSRFITADKSTWANDGLLGKIKYTGKLEEYLPLIKLGELVHIGEKAVLGFGRYRFTTQGLAIRNPKLSSK